MSDAHSTPGQDDSDSHEGPIKNVKQLILAVTFAFVVPIIVIVLLVSYVTAHNQPAVGSDVLSAEAIERRIRPVGHVEIRDASDLSSLKSGEQVYTAQCVACHGAGIAGAPKFGDLAAWTSRITQGYEALLASALKGKGAMAPQGGGDFGDFEIGRAVVYMANHSGAKFSEPSPPATAASAPQ